MKKVPWSEFKVQKLSDILSGPCILITGDRETAFYVVIKPQGGMIAKVEGIISQIDQSKGR